MCVFCLKGGKICSDARRCKKKGRREKANCLSPSQTPFPSAETVLLAFFKGNLAPNIYLIRDPNRPFDSRSLFRRRSSGQSSPTMSSSSPSSFPSKSRAWGRYDRRRQRYLKLGEASHFRSNGRFYHRNLIFKDLNPEMRSHYRLHAMSVWRHLIPRYSF